MTHSENGRQQAQKLSRYLSRVPQFGSDLIRQTGWWLLGGLESVMNLAGLDSDAERPQTGTPFLPGANAQSSLVLLALCVHTEMSVASCANLTQAKARSMLVDCCY